MGQEILEKDTTYTLPQLLLFYQNITETGGLGSEVLHIECIWAFRQNKIIFGLEEE